jgi:hypothetical protein
MEYIKGPKNIVTNTLSHLVWNLFTWLIVMVSIPMTFQMMHFQSHIANLLDHEQKKEKNSFKASTNYNSCILS